MTNIQILLATGGVLGILFVILSIAVVRQRVKFNHMLGDGAGEPDKRALLVAVRAHGNFAEYVPLALLLLAGITYAGANTLHVEVLAVALVVARICHALGIRNLKPNPLRAVGALGTFLVLLAASVQAILLAA